MEEIQQERILNVKNKPELKKAIELKSLEDLKKLIAVGNLVCFYEDEKEKIYFIQNFVYKEKK